MNEEMVITLATEALKTTVLLAGPMLGIAMIVGILVSVMQAVTQINETTLTFIPKMVAILIVLIVMGPWMLETIQQYTSGVLSSAGDWVRH